MMEECSLTVEDATDENSLVKMAYKEKLRSLGFRASGVTKDSFQFKDLETFTDVRERPDYGSLPETVVPFLSQ